MVTTRTATTRLDVRGLTITTAIAAAAQREMTALSVGDELELWIDAFPAIVPDLEAWCRTTGHELTRLSAEGDLQRVWLRKGPPRPNERRVAVVVSNDGLLELLSPLAFAQAAALERAQVSLYVQGPAVHVLGPGFEGKLLGLARPFSRFARGGLEKIGHAAATEKLRQLQALGGLVYACGPSLSRFKVDGDRLALENVTVCEYLTFMEIMQEADVQLYA